LKYYRITSLNEEKFMRPNHRGNSQLRPVTITRQFSPYAEGSCLIEFGRTKVLCTVSIEDKVPSFYAIAGKGG